MPCPLPSARSRRPRPLRPLRRPVRARNADVRAASSSTEHYDARPGRSGVSDSSSTTTCKHYVGRPSPLYFAERLTQAGRRGAHLSSSAKTSTTPGAHKINNCIGQALLTRRMGKPRVIAETGAGQHGVATATAAALFGLQCQVYMGEEDVRRQKLNVFKMRAMGTEVVPVDERQPDAARRHQRGDARLDGDRRAHALHHRQRRRPAPVPDDGPRFPGGHRPARRRQQCLEQIGRLPDVVVACVGGGSNAAGMFYPVRRRRRRRADRRRGRRPRRAGRASTPRRSATASRASCTARFSYVLQDDDGQTADVHSVSAGLDYPGVGPEHSYWKDTRPRALHAASATPRRSTASSCAARLEGILPALETAHAVVEAMRIAAKRAKDGRGRVCFSGRGDKDCFEVARLLGEDIE